MASAPSKPAPKTKAWKSGVCVLCQGPFKNPVIFDGLKFCRFCFANEKKKKGLCEEHGEQLTWFCTQEKVPICEACRSSEDHASHTVIPAEDAAQEYKSKLECAVPLLEQHLERALKLKNQEGKKTAEWKAGVLLPVSKDRLLQLEAGRRQVA
ncbi:E3 ubiquitin-protein ligase TRIM68-like [Heteronotia binoei]|uniref:E3 ubiquitin-protein ligase TRIM68-like n=1 Tax=Heteronotia binoei TaxID=13085 RepID=UPI00292FB1F4|nr:E3 ubiquitin-protein ligase TRIM68-like [Heteronotia binoei]